MGRTKVSGIEYKEIEDARSILGEDARARIVERYSSLVKYFADRAKRLGSKEDLDDLIQLGYLALLDAVEKFKRRRKDRASFRTYASRLIEGKMMSTCDKRIFVSLDNHVGGEEENCDEKRMLFRKFISLDKEGEDEKGKKGPLRDALSDPCVDVFKDVRLREIWGVVEGVLSEQEQNVLRMYYREGWTDEEIGKSMGRTKARVQQIREDALDKVRRAVEPKAA